tara:strand:- start:4273 stop:5313 length:1041 start_codon:yes stop_codon:yes gene_type:complete
MKTYRKRYLSKNKTKKNKNNFIDKLKKNFIIDAHIHFLFKNIRLGKDDNKELTNLATGYEYKKYNKLLAKSSWQPAGIIPCNIQPTNLFEAIKETAFLIKKAESNSLIKGIMSAIPVHQGKLGVDAFFNLLKKYDSKLDLKLIKIGRLLLTGESICSFDYKHADEKLMIEGLNALGERGILWKWNSTDKYWPTILKLTKICKKTSFIIDHLLLTTDTSRLNYKKWKQHMISLSKYKNIVGVDIAGIQQWKYRKLSDSDLKKMIKDATEIFGTKKIIIGSNWPVDFIFAKKINKSVTQKDIFDKYFNLVLEVCLNIGLSKKQICDIFRNNAIRIYNLNIKIKYISTE